MSFSSELKEELSKINNLSNKLQVKYEFIGYLLTNHVIVQNRNIRYATESEYNINRFSKLLSNLQINHKIEVEGILFVIKLKLKEINFLELKEKSNKIRYTDLKIEKMTLEDKKSIIRGTFLGSGSINNPENSYHLEIIFSTEENLDFIIEILKQDFNIIVKKLVSNKILLYIKEGETISNFLALIGANKGILKFEDIRVQKEMRSKVNRLVNCKTANMNKTINASIEQIEAIKKLQEKKKFNLLDENLKEIALLRLENPNMSLIELGKKLKKPLGKSGVNYRLKKIIEMANSL